MEEYVNGKTVALVGNAESLFNYQYGSEINDHQVVIRINNSAIFYDDKNPRHTHGTKIDLWAFWDVNKFATSQSSYRTERMDKFFYDRKYDMLNLDMNRKDKGFIFNNEEFGLDIKLKCKKETGNPSAGLTLLYLLNEFNPEVVNVYGFDFKQTKTFHHQYNDTDENRYDSFNRHDFKFEEKYANQKFFTQERFVLKGEPNGTNTR